MRKCDALLFIALLLAAAPAGAAPADYFAIEVVDADTGRGVPLVELRTNNNIAYHTDSAGLVAFHEPGLMDREVFFSVSSHGYEYPADGFGTRGVRLMTKPGGSATVKLKRRNIAERLYRITGQGIYRDTLLLGRKPPIAQPVLNGRVLGQDSVQPAIYQGKLYWFWGDTQRESYPLGQFKMSGATSELPAEGGLDPNVGVNLTYFVDAQGFSREMAPLPGPGVVWLDGVFTLRGAGADGDHDGSEKLIAHYSRRKSLAEQVEHGLALYNDDKQIFEKLRAYDESESRHPAGFVVQHEVEGQSHLYFAVPYALLRVKADWQAVQDPSAYEAFTCVKADGGGEVAATIDRDADGKLIWSWRQGAAPLNEKRQRELMDHGLLKPGEGWIDLRDAETGKPVTAHAGSVNFNRHRNRWVMIFTQIGGTSFLGEVWYAEADQPHGPWRAARKVVTHERYSFYNPVHHAFFDQEGGRLIYFEGTYTYTFSGNDVPTPRYDYNQVMYRLDLADPRLTLPAPAER